MSGLGTDEAIDRICAMALQELDAEYEAVAFNAARCAYDEIVETNDSNIAARTKA
jgi:hypothetical protein